MKDVKKLMRPQDVHCVVSRGAHRAACYDFFGKKKWTALARCDGAYGPGEDRVGGDTPLGTYVIGTLYRQEPGTALHDTYGHRCYDLVELEGQEAKHGRAGISWHGGRDASPGRPPAAWHDLAVTLGCVRGDDDEMRTTIDRTYDFVTKAGGRVYVTVVE